MSDIFERAAALGVEPLVRTLLGCDWGREVSAPDDREPCPEQAVQVTVVHDGPVQREFKLCQRHTDRIAAETDRHKHEVLLIDPYVPGHLRFECSCGERLSNSRAAAVAAFDAHLDKLAKEASDG